jgi:hypothetical protein
MITHYASPITHYPSPVTHHYYLSPSLTALTSLFSVLSLHLKESPMKRLTIVLPLLLALILLAGCFPQPDVAVTDADMATRVASILTEMPPQEGAAPPEAPAEEPVQSAPEVEVTLSPTETPEPTATEVILPPTEMPLPSPTAVPTETPGADATVLPAIPLATATQADSGPTPPPTLTPGTPVAAPTASAADPRNRLGAPASTDPMNNANTWNWPTGVSPFTSVEFRDGTMRLTGLKEDAGWRMPLIDSMTNLYVEMTAYSPSCSGKDNFGIIFRVPVRSEPDQGYLFSVSCDGRYNLWKWDGKDTAKGKATTLIWWKASAAIQTGSNATNRIGVMTYEDRLILYVNGVKVDEYKDKSFASGHFGVFVNPDATENYTVVIDEMSYWSNVSP